MNPYRSVRVLAQGGMGRVELVVRQEGAFRRAYAMKRLRDRVAKDPDVREMFTDEARIAGLLHHPNVVSVIDVGEDEAGPYLVMDYVQGVSLSQLLLTLVKREEVMPEQVALRIFIEIARGLHAAHELVGHDGERVDLVHRDISPQNVLVGFDGVTRLTDFGIAKARIRTHETSTGILKGKVGYFAPEQLRFHPVTARTDLFALGVVLFEAVTLTRLYKSPTTEETARRILEEPPPDPYDRRQDLHPGMSELLFRLLAKDPEHRPASAAEVASDLEAILVDLLTTEPPQTVQAYLRERFSAREREERALIEAATTRVDETPPRKTRRAPLVGAAVVTLLVVGGVAFSVFDQTTPTQDAREQSAVLPADSPPPEPAAEEPTAERPPSPVPHGSGAEPEPTPSADTNPETAAPPGRRRRRRVTPTPGPTPDPATPDPPRPSPPREPEPDGTDELMGWGP